MGRAPMPIGAWGLIRTYPVGEDGKSKPIRVRAMADYRNFDGVVRRVEASGRSETTARQNLRQKLQNRTAAGRHGELTGMTRFSTASDLWLDKMDALVADGRRSPGTVDPYSRQLKNHVLPAIGEIRLGECTTPLVDKVIGAIKADVSAATARSCRSVVSGVLGLSVRYGAITYNPGRDVERIEGQPRKPPRALTNEERVQLLVQLQEDEVSVRRDLPDLVFFMLATGVRIGEALGVLWSEVDFDAGTVQISSTVIRIKGEGLRRKERTMSRAGERTLPLPLTAVAMLRRRFMSGALLDQPLFPSLTGGLRDPANVRRELRDARSGAALAWITSHTFRKTAATTLDEAALTARLVAHHLGHSRTSMTQDYYLGRRSVDSQAAEALEAALRDAWPGSQNRGKTVAKEEGQAP